MKQTILVILTLLLCDLLNAQTIYSKDYGNKSNPAIIFVHGGPSGNSNLFEGTTAQTLADNGFYVIVYDRRGEGRSKDDTATMTFDESNNDLLEIYKTYNLENATILAHSFGGIVATLFTNQYPEKVNALILAGALFSQQETYDHILKQAKKHFKKDKNKLSEIRKIEELDKHSAEYRKGCFDIASELNFFTMPNPTSESKALRKDYEESSTYKTNFRNNQSPLKFYKNETQNNMDTKPILRNIIKKGIPIFAVYGVEDSIFSEKQLSDLKKMVGLNHFGMISNCSHYLFVDQQKRFIEFVEQKLKSESNLQIP